MTGSSIVWASLAAAVVALGAPKAGAQTEPDLWAVSSSAAAKEGPESRVAPIILGNAFAMAQQRDPKGVRTNLLRLQLMLAYIRIGQFDLFKSVYGTPDLKIDVLEFDAGMKDYIRTLRTLQSDYYDLWQSARSDDNELRKEALRYGAQHFAAIEVALRKRIASEEAMGLADALANEGLVFKKLGDPCHEAIEHYNEAVRLLDTERKHRQAMNDAGRAFALGEARTTANEGAMAANELLLPITIIQAAGECATDAIDQGNPSDAGKYIEIMVKADFQGQRFNLFVNRKWPCHNFLAPARYWRAVLNETRMNYARKFEAASANAADEYFRQADTEFKKALEIELFSEGGASAHFVSMAESYIEFLKNAGHAEDANRVTATIKSLGPADIGVGGPEAWRSVLDCPRAAM
jgi:hypothetical protein